MLPPHLALLGLLLVPATIETPAPRIALILIDDIGVDRVAAYAEHPDPGRTPNMDRLAGDGILFRRAYANPVCTSSRAAILTGQYGFRTGIGGIVRHAAHPHQARGLRSDFATIADVLPHGYRNHALGKWHLADRTQLPSHPFDLGFHVHAGSLYNLDESGDYFVWQKSVNGTLLLSRVYSTTDLANDVERYTAASSGPSFLWIAANAAHEPLHAPPSHLHSYPLSGPPWSTPVEHGKAMIEALDTELGRILAALGEDSIVILMGDNGTAAELTTAPFPPDHGKQTIYEGGIRVPLIIRAPGFAKGECNALVNLTDIFATVVELAGGTATAPDSISLVPYLVDPTRDSLRDVCYAERFRPHGPGPYADWRQALISERFKLVRHMGLPDELYDLFADRFEQDNLLAHVPVTPEHRHVYRRLMAKLPVVY